VDLFIQQFLKYALFMGYYLEEDRIFDLMEIRVEGINSSN
jgi:hypothetical protein